MSGPAEPCVLEGCMLPSRLRGTPADTANATLPRHSPLGGRLRLGALAGLVKAGPGGEASWWGSAANCDRAWPG